LSDRRVLLLIDGVNELPTEAARTDVFNFRHHHRQVPMVFTTRDLSLGGDLGIGQAQRLEMQPLTERQMQDFVRAYLPNKSKKMLRQLKNRLRELGQTPLLLWMLCSLFEQTKQIPQNLGEVFRAFTQGYERQLKQDVVTESDRRLWGELLQQLAARVMQRERATELRVAISPSEVYEVFATYLQTTNPLAPRQALDDLLKHHLIQRNGELIEFRHQLIQEYYAAEWLLAQLGSPLRSLNDDTLKHDYLNYLKWKEPVALMLALVTDQALAVRVVDQALAVDLCLGARLAGEVKPSFQSQTVDQITRLNVQAWLKVELFSQVGSEQAILGLLKALKDADRNVRGLAAESLGQLGSAQAIPGLLKALEHADRDVCRRAAKALGQIGSEQAIPGLLKALEDADSDVRWCAAELLSQLGSEQAIPGLLNALEHTESDVRQCAAEVLGQIGSEQAIPGLLKALEDADSDVRECAAEVLSRVKDDRAAYILPDLLKLLPTKSGQDAFRVIQAIQANCKYYNYEIRQVALVAQSSNRLDNQNNDRSTNIGEIRYVGILNTGPVHVTGDQIGIKSSPTTIDSTALDFPSD
jgi:HEAT repeats/PBS lyase HEAT-like repeat